MNKTPFFHSDTFNRYPWPVKLFATATRKLPFARAFWSAIGRDIWQVLRPSELPWQIDQQIRRARTKLITTSKIEGIKRQLESISPQAQGEPKASIGFMSRKLGNRDNRLESLLDSFVEVTKHPESFEILIKVDDDDDLSYFLGLKNKFNALNLRFFATPRGNGYNDQHLSFASMVVHASSSSKAWSWMSDDLRFFRNDWDMDVFNLIDSDAIFISGTISKETATTVADADLDRPNTIFSYTCEEYPFVSKMLVDGILDASSELPCWGFGDRFCTDNYISSLIDILSEQYGLEIYHQLDKYCRREYQRINWSDNPKRGAVRHEALVHFFSPEATATRAEVIAQLHQTGLLDQ